MTKKIFNSVITVAGIVLLASAVIIMGCLYNYFENVREDGLKDELALSAAAVEDSGISYLEKVRSGSCRITWIASDGTVIYDTVTGTGSKENHSGRAEVQSALETGEGQSNRYSGTLLEKTIYYAKRMEDGTVLRISVSSATAGRLALGMLPPVMAAFVIALVMSGMLARRLSRRIVKPLNNLDLEHPLENDTYEEISPLLNRISRQNNKIKEQFKELKQREAEFTQVTACMKEGLVLMDKHGIILSINPAANKIFGLTKDSTGQDFLMVYRNHEIAQCIKNAMETGHSETQQPGYGREYQFDASRIESAGGVMGAVLLVFDITEKVMAERNRREFTANVSHELKTPLQGITGSAELIENGMVKQEDLPRFTGHIRREAARLVALVEDIIKLSQLDEKTGYVKEETCLYEIAEEVVENLGDIARKRNIDIKISGERIVICGVRKLLYEIIYNLCDNAIKYNIDGGKVEVNIEKTKGNAVLTVSDTGIGIPQEHTSRVFERFYRVDKSHSKASGGTGLGLSIVKHAAAYHDGTIDLQSVAGKGTKVQVIFPLCSQNFHKNY